MQLIQVIVWARFSWQRFLIPVKFVHQFDNYIIKETFWQEIH
jgi:hypothetical protein